MLKEIIEDNGKSYLKYVPTDEELINMFLDWKKFSIIRPRDLRPLIKENLAKYDKMYLHQIILEKLKIK